ncbi:MAG TPA: GNAT family N-acetyltransferase [Bacteroidales bacterium]|nr:GNAT family N-acetyltransferase [Bacteroidales bacterium]
MKITIVKKYTDHLYDSVLRLLPQLVTEFKAPSEELVRKMLSSDDIALFVAETEAGEIAGILTLVSYPNLSGVKAWIEDVVVDVSFRGQSIGEQLVSEALKYANGIGLKDVKLTSRSARVAANKLYQKMGFIKYETNVYRHLLNN